MTPDPPIREDGRCARPGCSKRLKVPARRQRGVDPKVYADPFCSSECCKALHGVSAGAGAANKTHCSVCGCDVDEKTEGCKACWSRHGAREKAREAAAA
jgi:hypothetical protein